MPLPVDSRCPRIGCALCCLRDSSSCCLSVLKFITRPGVKMVKQDPVLQWKRVAHLALGSSVSVGASGGAGMGPCLAPAPLTRSMWKWVYLGHREVWGYCSSRSSSGSRYPAVSATSLLCVLSWWVQKKVGDTQPCKLVAEHDCCCCCDTCMQCSVSLLAFHVQAVKDQPVRTSTFSNLLVFICIRLQCLDGVF